MSGSTSTTSRLSVMSMAASLPSVGGYTSAASSMYSKRTTTTNILERHLNKTRGNEVSVNAFAFLFSEMLQYTQKRVHGIQDLERKLNELGYRVGIRALDLLVWRDKNSKRETRVLGMLYFIHTTVWKTMFGKQADSLEKSTENEDEYMISDNDPIVSKFISVPKDVSQLNCGAFMAGIVEAIMDGCQFPSRVTAHTVPIDGYPLRTTILIKLDKDVLEREEQLK
ncbi:TRAPP subunit trs31 [Dissophora globulifera]|uniref:Trafficking protein particle complex subunit n=1 Tax=Dissophora globulifera TaxID=979702 RepID=A0A9P6RU09_9FUNG|nr:TRAPP subunit trs31 [Dissophora globulifera]KAG0327107.1 TRAPP subunit trs31 [Dissophora globulifera]